MEDVKLMLSINEVMKATGLGRTTVFSLFKSKQLACVKVGCRTLVRRSDLETFVNSLSQQAA